MVRPDYIVTVLPKSDAPSSGDAWVDMHTTDTPLTIPVEMANTGFSDPDAKVKIGSTESVVRLHKLSYTTDRP
jgi:hypothetical protein